MQTLEQAMEEAENMGFKAEQPGPAGQYLPKVGAPGGTSKPNGSPRNGQHSPAEKLLLLKTLATACKLQKQYGQTEAELETLVEGFCLVLAEHPMRRIIEAMGRESFCQKMQGPERPSAMATSPRALVGRV